MQRRQLLRLAAVAPLMLSSCQPRTTPVQWTELSIASDGDQLTFSPMELSCRSGAHVRLTFHNAARYVSFEHNWVLIAPHSFDAVVAGALAAGAGNGWVQVNDPRVLAHTRMCARGQMATVEFIAPAAGDYLFICSYPGHAESMWGVLHVLG